jgi:hypothetical protein
MACRLLRIADNKVRLDAIQALLHEFLGRPGQAEAQPTPALPASAEQVHRLSWDEMTLFFATQFACEIASVAVGEMLFFVKGVPSSDPTSAASCGKRSPRPSSPDLSPVIIINGPNRLDGRRDHANNPPKMYATVVQVQRVAMTKGSPSMNASAMAPVAEVRVVSTSSSENWAVSGSLSSASRNAKAGGPVTKIRVVRPLPVGSQGRRADDRGRLPIGASSLRARARNSLGCGCTACGPPA